MKLSDTLISNAVCDKIADFISVDTSSILVLLPQETNAMLTVILVSAKKFLNSICHFREFKIVPCLIVYLKVLWLIFRNL